MTAPRLALAAILTFIAAPEPMRPAPQVVSLVVHVPIVETFRAGERVPAHLIGTTICVFAEDAIRIGGVVVINVDVDGIGMFCQGGSFSDAHVHFRAINANVVYVTVRDGST